ncbi:hypothetical protein [Streptomyces sp. A1547]|uniref:hypothetical protein n=1 Tax=Streptomyces sp. A1547 TaxID=2563105 RepID=UPI00109EDD64|nr:hypothetical protein [Streptomyces sp. A1547]THA39820.1 hypothetical protein E6W17_09605 [Streptomyces sp. A1547]
MDTDLTDTRGVVSLLSALKEAGAEEAVQQLSTRAAAHADLTSPLGIVLLSALMEAGTKENVIPKYGRETDGRTAAPWTWRELYSGPSV